jgi:hypothetical protein
VSAPPPARALVVVGAVDGDTADEALRAAVGLTLRGASVRVVLTDAAPPPGPAGERARATLGLFGHAVTDATALGAALADATVIEIWGPVAAPEPASPGGRVLHLDRDRTDDDDDAWTEAVLDHLLAGGTIAVW